MTLQAVQKYLLFSIIFFTISQFGKHFWPYFAYVSGIRVDYLSPTIYITDLLILLLLIVWALSRLPKVKTRKLRVPLVVHTVLLILSISIIVAKYSVPALYGAGKVLEMIFVGYMASRLITEKNVSFLCFLMSGAVIIEGTLVMFQLFSQSSVGGLWYFLGERTFSVASIGISTVSLFGTEMLRAYGSFPHPNVLAFLFLFTSTLFLYALQRFEGKKTKIWFSIMLGFSFICLLLTFSRLSIVMWVLICGYLTKRRLIPRIIGMSVLAIIFIFGVLFIQRFSPSSLISDDLYYRVDLAKIALSILSENPLFGVGINNHFYYQIDYQRSITPVLLQPVHNIFLLILLQVGLVGFMPVLYFLIKSLSRAKTFITGSTFTLQTVASLLFVCIVIIGMGDHYFVTLQQGMLLTAIIIGILWIPHKITD